jgi:hypothetical protein
MVWGIVSRSERISRGYGPSRSIIA